jgi:hypothetical protein
MTIRTNFNDGDPGVATTDDGDTTPVERPSCSFVVGGGEAVAHGPFVPNLWILPTFSSWFRRYFADLT